MARPTVFVYNVQTGQNSLVSISASKTGSGNGTSNDLTISSDGSTVGFESLANDLDPHITGLEPFSNYQVYARNLVTGTTTLVIRPMTATRGTTTPSPRA